MELGKVIGTLVSTAKDDTLFGLRLHVVELVNLNLNSREKFIIAVDSVGAGENEMVLTAAGSSARMTRLTQDKPVDGVIMAIVDTIELDGKIIYRKGGT